MSENQQSWSDWAREKAAQVTPAAAAGAGFKAYMSGTRSMINRTARPMGYQLATKPAHLLRAAPLPVKIAGAVGLAGAAGVNYAINRGRPADQ